jgi:hypothetical protein
MTMRWLSLILVWAHALNATVLFQAPSTSGLDYRAALKADGEAQNPTRAYVESHPSNDNRNRLLNLFAEAQKAFLGGTKEEAKARFNDLLALRMEDDWDRAAREIFLQAYFRLAQLELDPSAQTQILTQAVLMGDGLNVPADLFPPPIVRRYSQLKSEIPRQQISPGFFADGWSTILINGRPCTKIACDGIPPLNNEVRLTFVSDQWVSVSETVPASEINRLSPRRIAWVNGDCDHSTFHSQTDFAQDKKAFWGLNCGTTAAAKPKTLNFQPVSHADPMIPRIEMEANKRPFYKSPWFWSGLGAVLITAVVLSTQKQNERKEPSTTYGY